MLGDEGGNVAKDEQRKVCIEKPPLEGVDGMRDDGRDLGKKLLVVSGELGPPGVDKRAECESDQVVNLVVELGRAGGREEQRGQVGARWEVGEEQTSRETCGLLLVRDGRRRGGRGHLSK